ncbi:MAG: hypothetical protein AB1540_02855 [Bdellovibrionota bacterium]
MKKRFTLIIALGLGTLTAFPLEAWSAWQPGFLPGVFHCEWQLVNFREDSTTAKEQALKAIEALAVVQAEPGLSKEALMLYELPQQIRLRLTSEEYSESMRYFDNYLAKVGPWLNPKTTRLERLDPGQEKAVHSFLNGIGTYVLEGIPARDFSKPLRISNASRKYRFATSSNRYLAMGGPSAQLVLEMLGKNTLGAAIKRWQVYKLNIWLPDAWVEIFNLEGGLGVRITRKAVFSPEQRNEKCSNCRPATDYWIASASKGEESEALNTIYAEGFSASAFAKLQKLGVPDFTKLIDGWVRSQLSEAEKARLAGLSFSETNGRLAAVELLRGLGYAPNAWHEGRGYWIKSEAAVVAQSDASLKQSASYKRVIAALRTLAQLKKEQLQISQQDPSEVITEEISVSSDLPQSSQAEAVPYVRYFEELSVSSMRPQFRRLVEYLIEQGYAYDGAQQIWKRREEAQRASSL